MPSCELEVNLSGEALDALGIPTRLVVWGRIRSGHCQRVEFTVRAGPGGLILRSGQALTDSNGTWSAGFPMLLPVWPCGSDLWVEARCVSGGDCDTSRSVEIACKASPEQPGGPGNGGPGSDGPGGNGPGSNGPGSNGPGLGPYGDWPWDWPPHTWCPMVGRTFTALLLTALGIILAGSGFGNPVAVATGVAMVGAAFALLAFWHHWCAPNWCYVLGAVFWALSRSTIGGIALFLATVSVPAGLWTLSFGALAGMINVALLRRRCRVASLRTPLNQLPLW